jgi:hypothetical protein
MFSTALRCASNTSALADHLCRYTEHLTMSNGPVLTDQKQMRCGGCGGDMFKLFTADKTARIVVHCQGCTSTSFIEPEPATLRIKWGDGDGRISVF